MSSMIASFMTKFAATMIETGYNLPPGFVIGFNYDMDTIINSDNINVENAATPGFSVRWMPFFLKA